MPFWECWAVLVAVSFLVVLLLAAIVLKIYNFVTCGVCICSNRIHGKTVIVTGATSGCGKQTALELAKRGARVILACRNVDKANKVKDEIMEILGRGTVIVKELDLSSLASVRSFAEDFLKTESHLHVLIHNAGTAESGRGTVTADGLDVTMATNHFGPFLLTHLLIDVLKRSAPSRIIVVTSGLYRLVNLDPQKLNPVRMCFAPHTYYVSKYANIYTTHEFSKRLAGTGVVINSLHPGMVDTGIWRSVPFPLNLALKLLLVVFCKTPKQGSQTSICLALSKEGGNVSGKYFSDCKESQLCQKAHDENKAQLVWQASVKYSGLKETDPKI